MPGSVPSGTPCTSDMWLYFAVFTSFLGWLFSAMGRLLCFVYYIDVVFFVLFVRNILSSVHLVYNTQEFLIWGRLISCAGFWCINHADHVSSNYSRISFCDGLFYDDSLLRPLSSRTEHSWLVVHHCRNWSVFSLLSALLALFRCACVSSFSILVLFF